MLGQTHPVAQHAMRPLRLSFILSELRLSGGVRVVLEYAERLAARGHRVAIVSSVDPTDPATLTAPSNVQLITVRQRIKRRKIGANVGLAFALANSAPQSDFVIATHTPTVPSVLFACRMLGRGKAVWLYQDYAEMFADRPVERAILTASPRLFPHVFCVSMSSAIELWRLGQRQPIIVGEGISDIEQLSPQRNVIRNPNEILCIGDPRPRKGLADLIAAMQLVRRQVPEATLTVITRDEISLPESLPHRVIRLPSRTEIGRLLSQCGVFVSPSWYESFGLPPLEAMACGAPVVTTNSRGVRDYAVHEVNCLLVPPRAPQRMAEALVRLVRDRELANELGAAGIVTADRFTWDAAVDRLERALQAIHHRSPD